MLTFCAVGETDLPLVRSLAERIWFGSYSEMISAGQMEYMLGWMYSAETIRRELAEGVWWELVFESAEAIGYHSVTFGSDAVAKLNKLYLLPENQGRGFGQQMLARVMAVSGERGMKELRLQVNKRNDRARRAYERAGFAIVESAVFDIGGGYVMDDHIFSLSL